MIPREQVLRYHAHVLPVFWPVLWLNLIRLVATMHLLGEAGRNAILIEVTWTGRIHILFMADSAAERAGPCPLEGCFDLAPWQRLCPIDLGALAGLFAIVPAALPRQPCKGHGAHRPSLSHALAPP